MKCAFFFGAGASACVAMPTTNKMLEFLKEDKWVATWLPHIPIQDIEQFYTYLEDLSNPLASLFMARQRDDQSNVPGLSEMQNMRAELVTYSEHLRKWREDFIKKIQDYLIKHLNPAPHTVEYYEGLLVRLQGIDPEHSLKIITTNYDLLLDKSFNGDWNDGFVQIESGPAKTWQDKWDYDPSKPTLVKLHGSINVVDDRRHRKSKRREIQKYPDAMSTPAMLPLTHRDKDYQDEPYRGMLAQFKRMIADVDLLVVVGYTFRDRQIRDIIRRQLEKNLHVLLLDPKAKDVANKFENTAELVIDAEDGGVNCDVGSDFRVYWCGIKFERGTIDDISRIMDRVSELVGTGSADA